MNTTEKYAEKILEVMLKEIGCGTETPYQYRYLVEGSANYILIEQDEDDDDTILIHTSLKKYSVPEEVVISNFSTLSKKEKEAIAHTLQEKITKMFFTEAFFGKFRYKTLVNIEFQDYTLQFKLVHEARKAELKKRFDTFMEEVINLPSREMEDGEIVSFLDKLFDTELNGYTESQIIAIAEKTLKLYAGKKGWLKENARCLTFSAEYWTSEVFYPLYYDEKGSQWNTKYTLKEGITPEKIDTDKLNLYIQQALWRIKYKEYSWDVKTACEDLERAAKELGSEKAAMYLKKGTGLLPDNLIHYKDNEVECDANDVFAEISIKIKQETATAYDKALDFIIALLKADFPTSYQIKFSSKAPKQFLDIKGIAKSPTHRFFAQALQYKELLPKLVAYAKVAMKEFEWYNDVEEGEKSCMPGSYAVFGLGLIGEEYFPLVSKYFRLLDDEHQMIHKYFVSALIDRYGVNEKSLPLICQGITSAQFSMVFKNLAKEMEKPENRQLLDNYLKDKDKYLQEDIYYAIYGKNWKKNVKK
ncbi:MAG: DUF6138 family protein [Capnocytophaga sp.]|nr:DUF6138 family protein [Capnocytophaga sp.]